MKILYNNLMVKFEEQVIQNNKLLSYHLGETCFEELEQSQKTNY